MFIFHILHKLNFSVYSLKYGCVYMDITWIVEHEANKKKRIKLNFPIQFKI